jgi:hypothetical protein
MSVFNAAYSLDMNFMKHKEKENFSQEYYLLPESIWWFTLKN